MDNKKIASLAVVILSFIMLQCASQRTSQDSFSDEDEKFRQELLAMLEDAEDIPDTESSNTDNDDDILSILNDDDTDFDTSESETLDESSKAPERNSEDWWSETDDIWEDTGSEDTSESIQYDAESDADPTVSYSQNGSEGDSQDLPSTLNRMESSMSEKSKKLDSLRQVLQQRGERLDQLENKIKTRKSQSQPARMATTSGFSSQYQAARSQFENNNYKGCINSMQSLLDRYPNAKMADNCQYWIALSYFGMDQYEKALIEFQKVFAYEPTDKHDDAQLMIALSYQKLGKATQAQQAFQSFLDMYPDSEYVSVVRKHMNKQ